MDRTGKRESDTVKAETSISRQIDRLIDAIDNNTYAMRNMTIALMQIDQDDHIDDDGKISTYLDGSPK